MNKTLIIIMIIFFSFTFPVSALAAVEGLLTVDSEGSYYLYPYRDLVDSYALKVVGQPNGLYGDFKLKKPLAFLQADGSYIDYMDTIDYYAAMVLTGQKFNFENFSRTGQAKKYSAPASLLLVTVSAGELTRQSFSNAQPGTTGTQMPAAGDTVIQPVTSAPQAIAEKPPVADISIVASSRIQLSRATEWAASRQAHQRFIEIAPLYWEYGRLTGICPEVLYTQAAHETNFGHYTGQVPPTYNNWAGIKTANAAGDKPEDHEQFATPEDGVRAHFNHMAAYVGLKPIGEPHGRYFVVTRLSWAGSVKTVAELSGKWAPSATYHQRIVSMLDEMKE